MKRTLAIAMILGLAACGDKGKLDATAAESVPPKAIAKPAAVAAEPAMSEADKELAKRVAGAIKSGKLHGIDVEAAGGQVTLFGTTPTAKDRERAVSIAAKVEGVKSVENKLEVVAGS